MSNQDPQQPEAEGTLRNSPLGSDKFSYLICTQIGTHWRGRDSLQNLIVFGDSYSSGLSGVWDTEDDGGDYDTDDEDTTWVDFLASSRSPAVVVHNLAFPGATAEYDLDDQLARFLNQFSKTVPEEATFVFFLGINDCGGFPEGDLSSLIDVLFSAIQRLYVDVTARNFILLDVPPTNRSPAAAGTTFDFASRIEEWNTSLVSRAFEFASGNTEVTMLVFSSHRVLSEILNNPCVHGFAEDAKDVVGRGIWRDSLHLTRAVHEIIANPVAVRHIRGARDEYIFSLLSMMSLEINAIEGLLPVCTPSLMPFHISYSGPAPISRYLHPRPAPPSSAGLPSRSSSSATVAANSSTTSIMSGGVTSLTTMSSTTSLGSLTGEHKCQENEPLANARPSSIEMITQVEQLTVAETMEDTAVEMAIDSETQPVSDAVPRDDLSGSTVHIPASRNIERFVAAFRGRQMYGQGVDIPEGYGGLVLRTPLNSKGKDKDGATASLKSLSQKAKPRSRTRMATRRKRAMEDESAEEREGTEDGDCGPDADTDPPPLTRKLIPSSKFTSFMLWTPDRPLDDGRDEYARALIEWTRLSSEIHSYDE